MSNLAWYARRDSRFSDVSIGNIDVGSLNHPSVPISTSSLRGSAMIELGTRVKPTIAAIAIPLMIFLGFHSVLHSDFSTLFTLDLLDFVCFSWVFSPFGRFFSANRVERRYSWGVPPIPLTLGTGS